MSENRFEYGGHAPSPAGRRLPLGLLFLITLIVAALVFVSVLTVKLLKNRDTGAGDFSGTDPSIVTLNGEKYRARGGISTYLLIGLDRFGEVQSSGSYNNEEQSDFVLLLVADRTRRTFTLLHLNRDTMLEVDILGIGGEVASRDVMQLALSHTYGGGGQVSAENVKRAVSRFLYDVGIEHYVSMRMDAVKALNDYVGGVTLTLEEDLTEIDPSLTAGEVTLMGEVALKYVRARGGLADSSNLARMERQKKYLSALLEKISQQEITTAFIEGAYSEIDEYSVSDSAVAFSDLLEVLSEYEYLGIRSLEGEATRGEEFVEYYVDEKKLEALVAELWFEPYREGK